MCIVICRLMTNKIMMMMKPEGLERLLPIYPSLQSEAIKCHNPNYKECLLAFTEITLQQTDFHRILFAQLFFNTKQGLLGILHCKNGTEPTIQPLP